MTDDDLHRAVEDLRREVEELDAKFEALNRGRRYNTDEIEAIKERVVELEAAVPTNIDGTDYDKLSKDDKRRLLRRELVKRAANSPTGKASMDYKDVRLFFGGAPVKTTAYAIMEDVATVDGFEYNKRKQGNYRVEVVVSKLRDDSLRSLVNTHAEGEVV